MLAIRGLTCIFGGLKALSDVSFSVAPQQIVGLIGPNGAGKTTLFHCLTGVIQPTSGEITLRDEVITRLMSYKIARCGIARTFQNLRLFPELSALENVMIGRYIRSALPTVKTAWRAFFKTQKFIEDEKRLREVSQNYLEFVGLRERGSLPACHLSYGEQKRLEIARALAADPTLLLLDEPAAGMNPTETARLVMLIQQIRAQGVTLLLIEHNMQMVMKTADRIVVLDHGVKIAEGSAMEIRHHPAVIEAYLGRNADATSAS